MSLAEYAATVVMGVLALGLLGLALIAWAYLVGPREVVHAGQGLVWLGLFAALVVIVRRQPRAPSTRFELTDSDADDDPVDEAGTPTPGPSL